MNRLDPPTTVTVPTDRLLASRGRRTKAPRSSCGGAISRIGFMRVFYQTSAAPASERQPSRSLCACCDFLMAELKKNPDLFKPEPKE